MKNIDIILCITLCISFCVLSILLWINSAKIKGWYGEKNVSNKLSYLDPQKYVTLNDILIKNDKGSSSQIDHLVISIYGIFVIETKNYKGWIFGNEKSEKWLQVIYKEKNFFRNPIKQNWSHIYALKYILKNYNNLSYVPIVVFTGNAVLKRIKSTFPVIYDYDVLNFVKKYSSVECCSFADVQEIVSIIQNENMSDKEARKNHVKKIYRMTIEKQSKIDKLICPNCNGKLILRTGKNGKFYGCSNYPKCRFTKSYK